MEYEKGKIAVKLTKKNCKKVLGILKMFAEPVYLGTMNSLEKGDYENGGFPFLHFNGEKWDGSSSKKFGVGKVFVKPRQLRNILAKEHLKPGDTVVVNNSMHKKGWVIEFSGWGKNRFGKDIFMYSKAVILLDNDSLFANQEANSYIANPNFLRYATDEERALLEPKPKSEFGVDELEVGVWYVSKEGSIFNYQRANNCFGWLRGDWVDCYWNWTYTPDIRKATEHEVIEALTKECVKRYGKDWRTVKIKSHADAGCKSSVNNGNQSLLINTIAVWNKNGNLFYKGKWAEPLSETNTTEPHPETKKAESISQTPTGDICKGIVDDGVTLLEWLKEMSPITQTEDNRIIYRPNHWFIGERGNNRLICVEKKSENDKEFSRKDVITLVKYVRTFGLPNINSAEKLLDHLLQNIKS